jgi:Asp/Glu/hydantoin racemase
MNIRTDFPRMPPRVALLSSTRAVFSPMEAAFREVFPEAQIVHLLDETLIDDFRQDGGLSPRSRRKALQMAMTAQDAGVDGILVTCSTLSPSVDDLRPFIATPVVKIDEPVVEQVVQSAQSIALLTTADSVLKSVEPLVLDKARQAGRKVAIRRFVKGDIWPLLLKDPAAFYQAVGEAATQAAKECQAVIITQVSMAPGREYVAARVRDQVYASPVYAVRALRRILKEGKGSQDLTAPAVSPVTMKQRTE